MIDIACMHQCLFILIETENRNGREAIEKLEQLNEGSKRSNTVIISSYSHPVEHSVFT